MKTLKFTIYFYFHFLNITSVICAPPNLTQSLTLSIHTLQHVLWDLLDFFIILSFNSWIMWGFFLYTLFWGNCVQELVIHVYHLQKIWEYCIYVWKSWGFSFCTVYNLKGWKCRSKCNICRTLLSDIAKACDCWITDRRGLCWNASLTLSTFLGVWMVLRWPGRFMLAVNTVVLNALTQLIMVWWVGTFLFLLRLKWCLKSRVCIGGLLFLKYASRAKVQCSFNQ